LPQRGGAVRTRSRRPVPQPGRKKHDRSLSEDGLRYNENAIVAVAQTERRGETWAGAGLARRQNRTGRFSSETRYGGKTIIANRPSTSSLLLLLL
jgi:hypothetical protein